MATRSPTLTSATSDPASTTRAENSWPSVCGSVAPVRGCGRTGVTIGPTSVLVQVRAADAAPGHLDEDVVGRLQLRNRYLFEADVLLVIEASCQHRASLSVGRSQATVRPDAPHPAVDESGDQDEAALEDVLPGLGEAEERVALRAWTMRQDRARSRRTIRDHPADWFRRAPPR